MNETEFMEQFGSRLIEQAKRKAELYDGIQVAGRGRENAILFFLGCATEELGEVASAIMRERLDLAKVECIDLAHTAMLIAFAIETQQSGK